MPFTSPLIKITAAQDQLPVAAPVGEASAKPTSGPPDGRPAPHLCPRPHVRGCVLRVRRPFRPLDGRASDLAYRLLVSLAVRRRRCQPVMSDRWVLVRQRLAYERGTTLVASNPVGIVVGAGRPWLTVVVRPYMHGQGSPLPYPRLRRPHPPRCMTVGPTPERPGTGRHPGMRRSRCHRPPAGDGEVAVFVRGPKHGVREQRQGPSEGTSQEDMRAMTFPASRSAGRRRTRRIRQAGVRPA